ncbi:hypothetical protein LINPERHAP1_LOCUS36976 [Linum perenne]
MEDLYSF